MSAPDHGVAVWSSDAWRSEATAWLDAHVERTGPVEQRHVRPWSTVLRAPTEDGPVWFKAANPDTGFEPALYAVLQRVAPEHVLTPIAVDVARRWILLPDGGPTLGQRTQGPALVDAYAQALRQYAELQRALAPHAGELLDLGLADMRARACRAASRRRWTPPAATRDRRRGSGRGARRVARRAGHVADVGARGLVARPCLSRLGSPGGHGRHPRRRDGRRA